MALMDIAAKVLDIYQNERDIPEQYIRRKVFNLDGSIAKMGAALLFQVYGTRMLEVLIPEPSNGYSPEQYEALAAVASQLTPENCRKAMAPLYAKMFIKEIRESGDERIVVLGEAFSDTSRTVTCSIENTNDVYRALNVIMTTLGMCMVEGAFADDVVFEERFDISRLIPSQRLKGKVLVEVPTEIATPEKALYVMWCLTLAYFSQPKRLEKLRRRYAWDQTTTFDAATLEVP